MTEGQCHAMALALHERTGWPLAALVVLDEESEIDQTLHCGVMTPDGAFLDAIGAHDCEEMLVEDDLEIFGGLDRRAIEHLTGGEEWNPPDLEIARSLVDCVLALDARTRAAAEPAAAS
ncbi:hypothetical protein [Miltoncostaea oceani]|uniref:hypothetical protein n=1 Tax=Miltoncostaea oceani TaxID=2843216 RepID=UPI001C3C9ED2|nr:hypothetical protein [Miltoncostaea oceani]